MVLIFVHTLTKQKIQIEYAKYPALTRSKLAQYGAVLLSEDEISLGYIRGQFYRFSRGHISFEKIFEIVQESTLRSSKLISFLGNKKPSLNQNVRHDHATMQQDVLLHFWVISFTLKSLIDEQTGINE